MFDTTFSAQVSYSLEAEVESAMWSKVRFFACFLGYVLIDFIFPFARHVGISGREL